MVMNFAKFHRVTTVSKMDTDYKVGTVEMTGQRRTAEKKVAVTVRPQLAAAAVMRPRKVVVKLETAESAPWLRC